MKRNSLPVGGLNRGFTFVELLVVITIIAVLTAIGVANYSTVTKKSRDSRRKADLEQIRAALEIYRSDIGNYPIDAEVDMSCPDEGATLVAGENIYMDPIPCDPKTPDYDYDYTQGGGGLTYTLEAQLEVDTDSGTCSATGDNTYCVKQP